MGEYHRYDERYFDEHDLPLQEVTRQIGRLLGSGDTYNYTHTAYKTTIADDQPQLHTDTNQALARNGPLMVQHIVNGLQILHQYFNQRAVGLFSGSIAVGVGTAYSSAHLETGAYTTTQGEYVDMSRLSLRQAALYGLARYHLVTRGSGTRHTQTLHVVSLDEPVRRFIWTHFQQPGSPPVPEQPRQPGADLLWQTCELLRQL